MNRSMANRRMQRELKLLTRGTAAPGICAWPRDEGARLDILDAEVCGAAGTPYEGGVFRLEVMIPSEYPLKPPRVRFVTKIYHPNIDSQGRICLDSLNMPPKGAWKPSLNVATLLTTVQALMSQPNGDDGLMIDITEQFRRNPGLFRETARDWTKRYATGRGEGDAASTGDGEVQSGEGSGTKAGTKAERIAQESSDVDVPASDEDEITPARRSTERGSRLRKKARYS